MPFTRANSSSARIVSDLPSSVLPDKGFDKGISPVYKFRRAKNQNQYMRGEAHLDDQYQVSSRGTLYEPRLPLAKVDTQG